MEDSYRLEIMKRVGKDDLLGGQEKRPPNKEKRPSTSPWRRARGTSSSFKFEPI